MTKVCTSVSNMDDAKEFALTNKAMTYVGISDFYQEQVWQIVAAILHLGDIQFDKVSGGKSKCSGVDKAAELLGVTAKGLEKVLTSRTITTRGDSVVKPLRKEEGTF